MRLKSQLRLVNLFARRVKKGTAFLEPGKEAPILNTVDRMPFRALTEGEWKLMLIAAKYDQDKLYAPQREKWTNWRRLPTAWRRAIKAKA